VIGVLLLALTMPSRDVQRALPQQPTDTLRLYAVGDINLGRRLAKERLLEGDTLYPFLALRDSLRLRPTRARRPIREGFSPRPRQPPPRSPAPASTW